MTYKSFIKAQSVTVGTATRRLLTWQNNHRTAPVRLEDFFVILEDKNGVKHRHAMRAEPMTFFFHNMVKLILTTYGTLHLR